MENIQNNKEFKEKICTDIWIMAKRSLIFTTAAVAVLLFVTLDQVLPGKDANIVYAMEKAMLPKEIPIGYPLDNMAVDQDPVAVMLYYIAAFAEGIPAGEVMIPVKAEETGKEPQVKVDVDRNVEENEQKSVDAGHSPWKLDPVFVAQVYASLLLAPEGIVGDYPISYDDIMINKNDGTDAIAEIKDDKSIAKYVYMKRLIRQDNSGIWTVVGYDPAN